MRTPGLQERERGSVMRNSEVADTQTSTTGLLQTLSRVAFHRVKITHALSLKEKKDLSGWRDGSVVKNI